MRMGNWSLILVTSINVGSGPTNPGSLVSAQCPVKAGESPRPGKLAHGVTDHSSATASYLLQFPYLESIVPENYKWWEAPKDLHPVKISFSIKEFDFWKDETEFVHIYMKMKMRWEDFRILTPNMTEEAVVLPAEGGIWTPAVETSWIEENTCELGRTLTVFQNSTLSMTRTVQAKRR